jgi:succinyl-diaminopimelate desuccinylase
MDIDLANQFLLELLDCQTYNWPANEAHFKHCCKLITSKFSQLGFIVEVTETAKGPTILGYREGTSSTHSHFNGHYDMVPPASHQYPVQVLDSPHGRVYGRGSSDMKGGIVAMFLAIQEMTAWNKKQQVSFSFSPDEEIGGLVGTQQLIDRLRQLKFQPTIIIVGDSSYPDILVGHRGALWVKIKCSVVSSGRFSAIGEPSAFIIASIIAPRLEREMNKRGLQCVLGGECFSSGAINVWPQQFSFSADIRFDLSQMSVNIEEILEQTIKDIMETNKIAGDILFESQLFVAPCQVRTMDHDILSLVKNKIPQCKIGIGKGFSDLRLFRDAFSCNSFVLGPGEPSKAHSSDEYIDWDCITQCAESYLTLVEEI